MREYTFTLVYQLDDADNRHDEIVERFGEAGLTDFMLGVGRPGYLGLELERAGRSAEVVLRAAMADVNAIIPQAKLVEAGPDFAGLTDIAERVGMTRQNMRKLMLGGSAFPVPVHGGSTSIWHAAEVLGWLRDNAGYAIEEADISTARAAWRVNAALEQERMKRAGYAVHTIV